MPDTSIVPAVAPVSLSRQAPDASSKPTATATTAAGQSPGQTPLLLDGDAAAALCGMTPRVWRAKHERHLTPAPVKVGKAVRWRRSDLELWVQRGCPDRAAFEAVRKALQK